MVTVTMQQCRVEKAQVRGYVHYPHLWELFDDSYNQQLDQPRCVSAGVPNPPHLGAYNRFDTTQASCVHYECLLPAR